MWLLCAMLEYRALICLRTDGADNESFQGPPGIQHTAF